MKVTAENRKMVYIPEGFAHGFQTLTDNTEVVYQMSEFYKSDYARGIRWNDPQFKMIWPDNVPILSDKDQGWEDFSLK